MSFKGVQLANTYFMDIFTVGIITLLAATVIFFLIFTSFIYYWHLTPITLLAVPLIFTFDFFAVGFFVVALTAILLQYLPLLNF